jgi:hypothetical protein
MRNGLPPPYNCANTPEREPPVTGGLVGLGVGVFTGVGAGLGAGLGVALVLVKLRLT